MLISGNQGWWRTVWSLWKVDNGFFTITCMILHKRSLNNFEPDLCSQNSCENFVQNWPCGHCFSLGMWKYLEERLNIMQNSTILNEIPNDPLWLLFEILVYKSFYFQFPAMTIKNMIHWLSVFSQVLFWLMWQWSQFSCNVSSVFRVFGFYVFLAPATSASHIVIMVRGVTARKLG